MKSKFYYRWHPKLSHEPEREVEADYVAFEPGFVVFYEDVSAVFGNMTYTDKRLILAEPASNVFGLREVINDAGTA